MANRMNSQETLSNWGPALFVLVIGGFMAILDTSIVNIAIPKLESVFSVNTQQVQWVVTIYLLTLGAVVPLAGWLGDRYGYRRVYMGSLIIFTVGSALSGLSWSLGVLMIFRVLQAIGGGLIMPITMAMLYRMVPRNRIGTAMGIWGLTAIVAPAIGPTLGGYLVQYVDWRLIFYINVPIGIMGLFLSLAFVPPFSPTSKIPLDTIGFGLVAAGLFGLLLGLSEGETWGWTSERIVLILGFSVLLLILFVLWELRTSHPLLDLRVFAHGSFAVANLITVIVTIGMFSGIFYVPLFLQTVAGYGAMETGLMLMPSALATALTMGLSGRLYDKIGARPLVIPGLLILAYTTYLLHNLSTNSPVGDVVLWLSLRGLGIGLTMMPAITAGMSRVPSALVGTGSSINNIVQRVAGSFGLASLTAVLTHQEAVHEVYLSSALTPTSRVAEGLIHTVTQHLVELGTPIGKARSLTLTLLHEQVLRSAFVMAMDDVFVLAAWITLGGLIFALFLTSFHGVQEAVKPGSRESGDNIQEVEMS
ncbi:MAG: DHA2 family efflux MFS transporter permease subunit [Firmicutes bacterium]|uniref:MFS transporter n=1 Tax=Sulfobacillus benefaciens TaxID=453960 RepID=A0A2T2WT83_9FIRM|nr:DHA2 family efflux MFS transporter permease subunit [Bacillota bacterium]MCL5015544.1 DHA2 family efflux MFS transporter permease subunit [Bacillota bacterium]PSR25454.1 MAG: MFS transporter [Sulfobacillus benefaciens]